MARKKGRRRRGSGSTILSPRDAVAARTRVAATSVATVSMGGGSGVVFSIIAPVLLFPEFPL